MKISSPLTVLETQSPLPGGYAPESLWICRWVGGKKKPSQNYSMSDRKKERPQRTCWTGTKEVALSACGTEKTNLIVRLQHLGMKESKRVGPKPWQQTFPDK